MNASFKAANMVKRELELELENLSSHPISNTSWLCDWWQVTYTPRALVFSPKNIKALKSDNKHENITIWHTVGIQ